MLCMLCECDMCLGCCIGHMGDECVGVGWSCVEIGRYLVEIGWSSLWGEDEIFDTTTPS